MYPNLHKNNNFEPTSQAKMQWLATRKKEINFGGTIKYPALFSTYNYEWDFLGMLIAITGEFVGILMILHISGVFEDLTNIDSAIIPPVFGFIVDIIFLIILYKQLSKKCELENEKYVEPNDNIRDAIDKDKLPEVKRNIILAHIAFWLVCVMKLYFFIDYRGGFATDDNFIWAAFICYIIVAFLHFMCCTVYCCAAIIVTRTFNKEAKKLRTGNFNNQYLITTHRNVHFTFDGRLNFSQEVTAGQHGIEKLEDNRYCLKTWGILTDDDIEKLIQQQENKQSRECIAEVAKKNQWEILNSNKI